MPVRCIVFGISIICFIAQFFLDKMNNGEHYNLYMRRCYKLITLVYIVVSLYYKPSIAKIDVFQFAGGIMIGYVAYVISLFILGTKINKKSLFLKYSGIATREEKRIICSLLCKTIVTSFYEELLFRVCVLTFLCELCGTVIGVVITAVYFLLAHLIHGNKKYYILQSVDIYLFGLALNMVYIGTTSLLMCFIAHAIRNIMVIINNNMMLLERKRRKERIILKGRVE